MAASGSGCWWGRRSTKVLRQELRAWGAEGVRLLPITWEQTWETGLKMGGWARNIAVNTRSCRIACDWARSDSSQCRITKLKVALIGIHPCIYQSLVLLIAGVRKILRDYLTICGLACLAECNNTFPEQTVLSVFAPHKKATSSSELWLSHKEQHMVTPIVSASAEQRSRCHRHLGNFSVWEHILSVWVRTNAQSHSHK